MWALVISTVKEYYPMLAHFRLFQSRKRLYIHKCLSIWKHSSFFIHTSSFIILHTSFILHHSSFFIYPSFISRLLSFSACFYFHCVGNWWDSSEVCIFDWEFLSVSNKEVYQIQFDESVYYSFSFCATWSRYAIQILFSDRLS